MWICRVTFRIHGAAAVFLQPSEIAMCSVAHGEQAGSLCLLLGLILLARGGLGSWGSVPGAGNHTQL